MTLADAFGWYAGGLAVVGLASGFFAGSSHTPVIGTLLPLLFALIGGTSGIYIANADLAAPAVAERLRLVGRALACFGLACIVGSTAGIMLRLHYEAPFRSSELTRLWHGKTQEALQLAARRAKLRMLSHHAVQFAHRSSHVARGKVRVSLRHTGRLVAQNLAHGV